MTAFTRPLKVGRLVTYFRPTTGKRVPAQVVSFVSDTATLKLASGAAVAGVTRQESRTGFGSWGFVRSRVPTP